MRFAPNCTRFETLSRHCEPGRNGSILCAQLAVSDRCPGFRFVAACAFRLALVVEFLTLGDGYLAFYPAVLHVKPGWHHRQSFFASLGFEFVDFAAVQEQLSRTRRRVVELVAVAVLADVRVQKPGLTLFHRSVGVAQLHLARFRGFDFSPGEGDTRFITVQQEEIVSCLAIVAQDLRSIIFSGQIFLLNACGQLCVKHVVRL